MYKSPNVPDATAKAAHKQEAVKWAQSLIQRSDWVLLDTETTGTDTFDEVLQISIVGHDGSVLLNQLTKPRNKRSWPGAEKIHGITPEMLSDSPTLVEIWPKIKAIVEGKTIIAYNANFDRRLLEQSGIDTCRQTFECAMRQYSQFVGEWVEMKGEYKWQKLPRISDEKHDAAEDCILTLQVIKAMAEGVQVGILS